MNQNPYQSPATGAVEPDVPQTTRPTIMEAIGLRSFIWLSAGMGFSFGLLIGIACLFVSHFGGSQAEFAFQLPDAIGGQTVAGWAAGLCLLVAAPCYFCLLLTILAIPTYLPFSFVWKLLRKRKLIVEGSPVVVP